MHNTLRKLLADAEGVSEFVVAVNLDIRDFSSFTKEVDSQGVGVFLKRVYTTIIDNYFADASFFKPAGDGMLITIPYTEDNLTDVVPKTIDSCLQIITDFGSFCVNDPMINFEVPAKVGIGLSRGSACRLVSEKKVLDYSGKVLNLASRLMDLARPSGIVFDSGFGIELLSDDQIKKFEKDSVYVRGIAEKEPLEIYYTKELTDISPLSKQPLEELEWNTLSDTKTLKQIKDFTPRFGYYLESEPRDQSMIRVKVSHDAVIRGRRRKGFLHGFTFPDCRYWLEAGKPRISIDFAGLAKRLEEYGVKDNWDVTIQVTYPER